MSSNETTAPEPTAPEPTAAAPTAVVPPPPAPTAPRWPAWVAIIAIIAAIISIIFWLPQWSRETERESTLTLQNSLITAQGAVIQRVAGEVDSLSRSFSGSFSRLVDNFNAVTERVDEVTDRYNGLTNKVDTLASQLGRAEREANKTQKNLASLRVSFLDSLRVLKTTLPPVPVPEKPEKPVATPAMVIPPVAPVLSPLPPAQQVVKGEFFPQREKPLSPPKGTYPLLFSNLCSLGVRLLIEQEELPEMVVNLYPWEEKKISLFPRYALIRAFWEDGDKIVSEKETLLMPEEIQGKIGLRLRLKK